jgi:pyruvate/2-oxoglutarate dehydrogenase complex dihydrolipoamide acyltransferase (E2) component
MAIKLTAPRMGEGVEELTLVKWLKQTGDAVEELEAVVEVETDKVVTELPSPANGVILKMIAEEGDVVKVGDVLAWIGEAGEKIPEKTDAQPIVKKQIKEDKKEKKSSEISSKEHDTFLSPLVRKMIAEHDLDSTKIPGSGKDGRITKNDVLADLENQKNPSIPEAHSEKSKSISATKKTGLIPISTIRRTIAERMIDSLSTSAHVLTVMEADLSRVMAHRTLNKPLFAEDGVRLTLTAYFIAAIVAGLKANPKVNSSWTGDGLMMHPAINIGMAVSLGEEGLIVPVIKNADTLSLLGIAQKVSDLAERARIKKLQPDEVRDGTFSLTNHGMSGSLFATPIITQPQVGILGTGMVQKRAVVISDERGNDMIAIRPMMYLSFVFDHRVLDGEGADNFLHAVVDRLENWN